MLTQQEERVLGWLGGQRDAMISLLAQLVNQDSGSFDKEGVDRAGRIIEEYLEGQSIPTRRIALESFGDGVVADLEAASPRGHLLFLGHRDTVFPKCEAQRRPFTTDGNRAYGPGVADMKGGLVLNLFVVTALVRTGWLESSDACSLRLLVTSDEEIGSPACRPMIENAARGALAVFNSEPGRANGSVVTGRKGGIFLDMEVEGVAAHSGAAYADGRSAIEALARKIIDLHALTDLEAGMSVNVGLIGGGQSVNTVAPHANAKIDLRYREPADRDRAVAAIHKVIEAEHLAGTSARARISGEFLPLVPDDHSSALIEIYQQAAKECGLTIVAEFSGGCADSGFTASVGAPTLCGVGPIGGKGHRPDEYLELSSLVPRAQAMALAAMRVARKNAS